MWMMQSGGMTNFETLRAATIHGADAIGVAKDLGSSEVGKLADLQVLDGIRCSTSGTRTRSGS
jgi:imidazolonepropionase-like amidohydrolase